MERGLLYYVYVAVSSVIIQVCEGNTIFATEGENKVLQWTITPAPGNIIISVLRPSDEVLFSALGTSIIPGSGSNADRVSNTGNTNTNTGYIEFTLNDVRVTDARDYRAQFTSLGRTEVRPVGATLVVYDNPSKPVITVITAPVLGQDMSLRCSASSNSKPDGQLTMKFKWYINSAELPDDSRYVTAGSQLQVKNIKKSDKDSTFSCKGYETTSLMSVASDGYKPYIRYRPDSVTLSPDTVKYDKAENDNIGTITCSADCNPPCIYQWKFNDGNVGGQTNTLTLNNLQPGQAGLYLCTATNDHGIKDSQRITVTVKPPTSVSTTPVTVRSDIACNGDRISVFVPKNLLPAGQRVTWRDQDCSVSDNGTHYIGSVDFSNCGTTVQFTNDSVQFRNELISHNRRTGNSSIIDFGSEYDTVVPVECDYPKKANTMSSYLPIHERVQFVERRMGNLQLQMQQTADATFHDALPQDGSPRKVPINQDIFIKLSSTAANRSDVGIRVDNCVATPTASPADSTFQTLVDNGCPALDAVTRYDSPSDEARFGVRAFQFTSAPASLVYVHCQVSVCPTSDPQCVTSCTPSTRRRRSVQSGHESHLVSSGPYLLVAEQGSAQVATIVAAVCGLLAVVATTFAVIMWRKMRKNGNFKHVDE